MSSDELSTMYGNPVAEFLMFLVDFAVFAVRSVYFLLETFILTILPDRYRKLKVSYAEFGDGTLLFCTLHQCQLNPMSEFECESETINSSMKSRQNHNSRFHNVFEH